MWTAARKTEREHSTQHPKYAGIPGCSQFFNLAHCRFPSVPFSRLESELNASSPFGYSTRLLVRPG
jgi:hypothetical protein